MSDPADFAPQFDAFLAAANFVSDSEAVDTTIVDPRMARLLLDAGALIPSSAAEIASPPNQAPILTLVK